MNGGHCPACGQHLSLVWVHGHGQCAACGSNVAPCCSGAGDEVDAREDADSAAGGIETLVALLEDGGAALEQDLLNRFAARTACGVELGRELLSRAVAEGRLLRSGAGVLSLPA